MTDWGITSGILKSNLAFISKEESVGHLE